MGKYDFKAGQLYWHRGISRLGMVYWDTVEERLKLMFFNDGWAKTGSDKIRGPLTDSPGESSWLLEENQVSLEYCGNIINVIDKFEIRKGRDPSARY